MSSESDLPNDLDSARSFIERIIKLGVFDKIFLSGSRSPLREKQPKSHSDWDFIGVTSIPKLVIARPRATKELHGDIGIVYDLKDVRKKSVEIYPTDDYGILNGTTRTD